MLSFIRVALRRPQTFGVLALLILIVVTLSALFMPVTASTEQIAARAASFPAAETLLEAVHDDANWVLPAKTYSGNRYTQLTQIDKTNITTLGMAWRTSISFYSMAAYVYKNQLILGTGGGDNGTLGLVSAFSIKDGRRLWDWQAIPGPGQPGHETWPGNSWQHGGGAVWSGLAVDQGSDSLFVAPGNPGPDMVLKGREGENLYTDSVGALDISGPQPRIKWYYKILQNDSHDDDPAMIPVLFEGQVDGQTRPLVAIGDRAGDFLVLDRATGQVVQRLALNRGASPLIGRTARGGNPQTCPSPVPPLWAAKPAQGDARGTGVGVNPDLMSVRERTDTTRLFRLKCGSLTDETRLLRTVVRLPTVPGARRSPK